jgi:hypothetical protein
MHSPCDEMAFTDARPYVQFQVPAFSVFAMVHVEYGKL